MEQLQQVRKLGSMKKLLGMMPGMAAHRQELEQFDDKEIDRTEAIIRSMTPQERRDTKIIDGSRRARIAAGAGVSVSKVNALLQRFEQAAKMMKRMSGGAGMPGMGGIPGFGGPGGKSKRKDKKSKKKGGKSGNPMRREAEERALRERLSGESSGSGSNDVAGSAFAKQQPNPQNLPEGLQDLMNSENSNQDNQLPPNFGGGLAGLFGK